MSTVTRSSVLAGNVRRMRAERGMTLGQLAARSGIAKATLSTLEGAEANPRLDTLEAIARAFGVELEALLARETSPEVVVVRDGEGVDMGDSAMSGRLCLALADGPLHVEVHDLALDPGLEETSATHGAGAREHVIVRDGTLEVGPLGATVTLRAGDYATYAADRPHLWRAVGARRSRFWVLLHTPLG